MRHRHALLFAALLLGLAATPDAPAASDTVLKLSETATVMVHPDELAAVLRAEATAPTAAEAQRQVNAAMADALTRARLVPGVTASTGGYGVYRDASVKPERWQASQTLALRSADGASLQELVGALQQKGLAVSDLHWQLSDAAQHDAQAKALRQAISALRARVDDAAGLLGLAFVRFQEVRLNQPQLVRPMMMRAATMSAAAAPTPPTTAAEDIPVSATVEADAALAPK